MKKAFDCVEMKRQAQERIYEETRGLSPEQELEYFHEAGRRFWQEMKRMRKDLSAQSKPSEPAKS